MFWLLLIMTLNAGYVAALPSATVAYITNVLLHIVLGAIGSGVLIWKWRRSPKMLPVLVAAGLGIYLIGAGATTDHRAILIAHVALAVAGMMLLLPRWTGGLALATVLALVLRFGAPPDRIRNPKVTPASMTAEGAGPKSPFWPSSSNTNTGQLIPSDFFMDSKMCGECHKQAYEEWNSSMHHFASMNNPYYKATILHMQELNGTQGSKWCAGCHDHAVFFNGRFERPLKEQVDTPEAQNGLGCMSCHSISHIDSTMGQGGFEIMYPPLHPIASHKNPIIRQMDRFVTFLNPEPHRRTFMKAFMRQDNSEYCSTCHKVHLDQPVNNYRWIRGLNEYDNWQGSGVSGQGARSFYYPPKSATCGDCHMPLEPSKDPGNRQGQIHSHRFAAANMAIAAFNKDETQMKATEQLLKSGFITIDVFAASPVEGAAKGTEMKRRASDNAPALSTSFAVGEESDQTGPVTIREVGKVAAPLNGPGVSFKPGSRVRIDTVVRTRKIGHFFPGGTVDGFDVWVEFQAKDAKGRILSWSGKLEDGTGYVEKGAHMYRAFVIDADGNQINKRNLWQGRSTLYVRLIPPGAADTVHYLVDIPKDVEGPITLEAKLNYRKFAEYYNKFAFAGVAGAGSAAADHDSRQYTFDNRTVPAIPIITLATSQVTVPVGDPQWTAPSPRKQDRERWNDWGIGMLLQGDLKGAEYAFQRVMEAEPGYADGYVNVARALVQEGETEAARPHLEKAISITPNLARAYYFLGLVEKAAGNYDAALNDLEIVRKQYPRDRVVSNQIGRVMFLQRRYADAIQAFEQTLAVDPEDLQAHYNLMLCYRGMGQADKAEREQGLFLRFKTDESAQALNGQTRLMNPEVNNERQQIHDHTSDPGAITGRPVLSKVGGGTSGN